jgi:hypothetical protein
MKRIFPQIAVYLLFIALIPGLARGFDQTQKSQTLDDEKREAISQIIEQVMDKKNQSELIETLNQMDINFSAIDSIFGQIPIPENIKISNESILIDGKEFIVTRRHKTEQQGIVKFSDNVIIGRNELINGNIIIFGGDAIIYGTVRGGVVVLGGNVRLFSTSSIQDDVICIWGTTEADPGAHIAGKTIVFNSGKAFKEVFSTSTLSVAFYIFLALLFITALIIQTAFPSQIKHIRERIRNEYIRMLAVGFTGAVLFPVLFILLLATILGIPIAILVLPMLYIGGFLLGGTAFSILIGQIIKNRTGLRISSSALLFCLGFLVLVLPILLSKIFLLFSTILSTIFFLIGIFVILTVLLPGLGAAILTKYGTRS